jgi:hypothetical protein
MAQGIYGAKASDAGKTGDNKAQVPGASTPAPPSDKSKSVPQTTPVTYPQPSLDEVWHGQSNLDCKNAEAVRRAAQEKGKTLNNAEMAALTLDAQCTAQPVPFFENEYR